MDHPDQPVALSPERVNGLIIDFVDELASMITVKLPEQHYPTASELLQGERIRRPESADQRVFNPAHVW
jgi:hypothetical protein